MKSADLAVMEVEGGILVENRINHKEYSFAVAKSVKTEQAYPSAKEAYPLSRMAYQLFKRAKTASKGE